VAFVREIGFSHVHVFPYSEREGTDAAFLPGSVPIAERRERANRLIAIAKELENDFLRKQIGLVREVLLEEEEEGFTREYLPVRVAHGRAGEIAKVRIVGMENGQLTGEWIEEEGS